MTLKKNPIAASPEGLLPARKRYGKPQLSHIGSLAEITQAARLTGKKDNGTVFGMKRS